MQRNSIYNPDMYKVLKTLFPQLERVDVLSYSPTSRSIQWVNNTDGETETLAISEENKFAFQKFRAQVQSQQWVSNDELPWVNTSTSSKQFLIEDELDKHILILSYKAVDGNKDCIFIHLPNSLSGFMPVDASQSMRTDQKSIIATMANRSLDSFFRLQEEQNNKIAQIKNYYLQAEASIEKLQAEKRMYQDQYLQSIRAIGNEITIYFQKKSIEVILESQTIEKLAQQQLSPHNVHQVLKNSIDQLLVLFPEKNQISLAPHNIVFDLDLANNTPEQPAVKAREDKAFNLLERYEKAAIALETKQIKVNGKNIAQYLKITPPAITDAFKKNEKGIFKLLIQNPSRWHHIRNALRPVQKIIDENRKAS